MVIEYYVTIYGFVLVFEFVTEFICNVLGNKQPKVRRLGCGVNLNIAASCT